MALAGGDRPRTVWILDGLEVTIVGSMSEALKPEGTGLGMSSYQVGVAGAVYVAGACIARCSSASSSTASVARSSS